MAKDYIGVYRKLLTTRTSSGETQLVPWLQVDLNGGNGMTPVSIDGPPAALFDASLDREGPL